jgi:hypothetical protein
VAIEAVDSALDAIAAYLNTALTGTLTAMRGWPEANVKVDASPPVVAITAGDPVWELCSPVLVDQTGSGTLTCTYKVGLMTVPVQLDLWSQHRYKRDVVGAALTAKLHNRLPRTSGLWLTQADYYGRPISIEWTRQRDSADGDTATRKQWRRTWEGELTTDLVVQATFPELQSAILRLTTSLGGVEVAEADATIP